MKFRKEDAGLYFASSLVGAGIGLLVGAFIASRRARIVIEEEPEGPAFDSEEEERSFYRMNQRPKTDKIEPKEEDVNLYSPELVNFIDEVQPSAIQIEIHKGFVTMDDVREAIKDSEQLLEPYEYAKTYQLADGDIDKPDLADITKLPEDLGLINERFRLSVTLPKGRSVKKVRTIFYDEEDDTFVQMRGDRFVPLHSLDGILTTEVWDIVFNYLLSNLTPIFALDTNTEKLYSFDLVPAKEESDDMVADDLN